MTKSQKNTKALRGTKPRLAAALTRAEYAVAVNAAKAAAAARPPRGPTKVVIVPLQVDVTMQETYAAELLAQLRVAGKMRRGECHQITIDCPITFYLNAPAMNRLLDELETSAG